MNMRFPERTNKTMAGLQTNSSTKKKRRACTGNLIRKVAAQHNALVQSQNLSEQLLLVHTPKHAAAGRRPGHIVRQHGQRQVTSHAQSVVAEVSVSLSASSFPATQRRQPLTGNICAGVRHSLGLRLARNKLNNSITQ